MSRLCGTSYAGKGTSSSSAGVLGYRAGEAAAKYAAGTSAPSVSKDQISRVQNDMMAPRKLKRGYDPRWVQEVLLATMAPYYVLKMKHKNRLQGALENIMFMRDHIVPKAMADDPHELRLCHEVHNMVLNAEMKLRSSLFREESRGTHFREDFPYRDDKNWLAWTTCKMDSKGNMVLQKEPVPDRMKTNKDMPYAKRYSISFPGEQEAIDRLGIK
jgi:succinate dehydrogenase/fumarate reductase flavoprotein subunit